jgi:hypothetical protein
MSCGSSTYEEEIDLANLDGDGHRLPWEAAIMGTAFDTSVSDRIAARFEAELEPLLSELRSRGGYNCCGCSTYEEIYEHALRIVHEEGRGHPAT